MNKVAITIPPELLRLIDAACRAQGVSRSEFIRRAVDELFARQAASREAEAYEDTYRSEPESDEEIAAALHTASAAIAQEPW